MSKEASSHLCQLVPLPISIAPLSSPWKSILAIQTNHSGLSKKRCYHFWLQQSNLPGPRLEQGRHGLPAFAEGPSVLFHVMAHCICRQHILYWCRVPVCTHWGWSSCNCLDTRQILHIYHGLLKSNSSNRPSTTNGDRNLSKINIPHLFRLKEKCLGYFFNYSTTVIFIISFFMTFSHQF